MDRAYKHADTIKRASCHNYTAKDKLRKIFANQQGKGRGFG
ncbi:hypothetical protein BN341_8920 [Helicobacter heilmannii ASB1.4]|uniref:Uncharacterized protein n=1 Tax=Helicobacter heilmannii TaxID=35817 RepID=A0A0K2Y853_HELHE|nr:hypothetical protein BN341_8920 [Helicobacter heilmannii ASB1.4]CRI35053.1 hypothetical protein HHE01_00510 [Helicobacter heilmannii]